MGGTAVLPCGCTDSRFAALDAAQALLPGGPAVVAAPHALDSGCELQLWAASGGMHLTGDRSVPRPSPAPVIAHAQAALALAGARWDAASVLFGRAAWMNLDRAGRFAPGGTCRLVRTADTWAAVNLSRPEDLEAIPAILGEDLFDSDDPIGLLDAAARFLPAAELAARCQLFGVPASVLGGMPPRAAVLFEHLGATRDAGASAPPRVVDLSSLWAGPLCARLLADAGAEVIKVESTQRPDGGRRGSEPFFDWLHAGHRAVAIDFSSEAGRRELRALVERADVVIEASRPRALRGLGIIAEDVVAARPGVTWVSITGHGRSGVGEHLVAFGDDAAVAGGLVAVDPLGEPVFCGDAIADPLTGAFAAMAVLASHAAGGGDLLDVSMSAVAAHVVSATDHRVGDHDVEETREGWVVHHGGTTFPIERPRAPASIGAAEPFGASNGALAHFLGA